MFKIAANVNIPHNRNMEGHNWLLAVLLPKAMFKNIHKIRQLLKVCKLPHPHIS